MKINSHSNLNLLTLYLCWIFSLLVFFKLELIPADYENYKEIYNQTYYKINDIEVLFVSVTKLFYSLGFDYDVFAMLVCALCLTVKVTISQKIIENTTGLFFLVIYICFFAFIHELTQIRTAIATTFFYIAVYLTFFKRKTTWAFLYLILATFFHISSLFAIAVLFINNKKKLLLAIMILMVFWLSTSHYLMALYEHIPNEKIQSYLLRASKISTSNGFSLNVFSVNNIIYFLCLVIVVIASRGLVFTSNELALIKYTQYSNVLGFFLFYIFEAMPVVAFRLPEILRITYPLVLALVVVRRLKIKRDGIVYIPVTLLLSALMCFITIRAVVTVTS